MKSFVPLFFLPPPPGPAPGGPGAPGESTGSGEGLPSTDLDALVTAAWLYYHHDVTQAEIARRLGVSRATVANLLARAKQEGVVHISLRPDLLARLSLAQELRARFSLTDIHVVPVPAGAGEAEITLGLAEAGARYLEGSLRPGEILGTAWGITMLEVARALRPTVIEGLIIAQALGGLNSGESFNPTRVATLMAEKLGARVYHLYVPAVVESVETKEILLRDRSVRACLEMARAPSRLMIGIGKVSPDATVVRAGFLDPITIDELAAKGAVGDFCNRYFDLRGRPVVTGFDERIVGLSWEDLRTVRPVIAVAGGADKVAAVTGALRTGCVDVLITDEGTARAVLALARATTEPAEPGDPVFFPPAAGPAPAAAPSPVLTPTPAPVPVSPPSSPPPSLPPP